MFAGENMQNNKLP